MKDFKILKFLDKFENVFKNMDIDYKVMRLILEAKLTMDGRRMPTIIGQNQNKNSDKSKKDKNTFLSSLWIYMLIGVIMIPIMLFSDSYVFTMSILFSAFMFMIMTSLISDFSTVLLDIRDKNILTTKPVNGKTVNMAKAIHILIYMFYLTLSLAAGTLVTAFIRFGLVFFLLYLFEIILMDLLVIAFTAILYTIILRFFDGEKLKDIINYVQIGLSLVITIGYQLVGRVFSFIDFDMVFEPRWWQYFIPPVWFGGSFEVLLKGNMNIHYIVFAILTLLAPIVAIIAYVKLIPTFEKNLIKLNDDSSRKKKSKIHVFNGMESIICTNEQEKIFYRFASSMMIKEREFKLKVYPSLGFSFIFPYIFFINTLQDSTMESISSGKTYLFLYFSAIMIPTVLTMLKYSGNYKGAWIYKVMPIPHVKPIFSGTIKAFLVNLMLPLFLLNSIIFMFIFGIRIIPDLFVIALSFILLSLIAFFMLNKHLPFSLSFQGLTNESGMMIILMFVGAFFAVIHWGITMVPFGVYIYFLLLVAVTWFAWKKILNISWKQVESSYTD